MSNDEVLFSEGGYVCGGPQASNNTAEYSGMLAVLRWIDANAGMTPVKITIRGDSKLVINQLSGAWNTNCIRCGKPLTYAGNGWRCRCEYPKPGLYFPFYVQASELFAVLKKRHKITLEWVPREQNGICDVLSKGVLKERGIEFKIQPEG